MTYRTLTQIYPEGYAYLPDEEDVRRRCTRWCYDVCEHQTPYLFTQHLIDIVNPFDREYYASVLHDVIQRLATCEYDAIPVSPQLMEQIEADLQRVVRRARAEQSYEQADAPQANDTPLHTQVMYHLQTVRDEVASLRQEVIDLQRRIGAPSAAMPLLWPTYAPEATEDDKQSFELYMRQVCTQRSKALTQQIKTYLALKVKQHVIIRPALIKDEYRYVRAFGYPYTERTYYNA